MGDCWLWEGKIDRGRGGYGMHGRERAHRRAWRLAYGPIPKGLFVCHHCDTPLCIRPDHLFLGTHSDNMRDMVSKGRHRPAGRDPGVAAFALRFLIDRISA